jgi:hypothetical protein
MAAPRLLPLLTLSFALTTVQPSFAQPVRPFGTLRDQAALQQDWLKKRLDRFLPTLMRKHAIDMWIVP